jgi:hypothetical protein
MPQKNNPKFALIAKFALIPKCSYVRRQKNEEVDSVLVEERSLRHVSFLFILGLRTFLFFSAI